MRLFTGLPISDEFRNSFSDLFGTTSAGVRPVRVSEMHITLQFVGEIDDEAGHALANELTTVHLPPFELRLDGVGCFEGKSKHRILYVHVSRSEPLLELHDHIGRCMESVGLSREERPYNPHVTLARLKRTVDGIVEPFMDAHSEFRSTIAVDRFVLYRVHKQDQTQHYERWREYPFLDG